MNQAGNKGGLKRVLGALDLTAIGVGAIIGAGIFVLTGTAAKTAAGPSIMLSYIFAGTACILAALCYAEFATRMPISGSAYTYAYATVGELVAWIIGWDLILEYTIGASAVAVGWTHYLQEFVEGFSKPDHPVVLPPWLLDTTIGPLHVNVAACLLIIGLTTLLCIGVKESARFNGVMVLIKLCVVLFVIVAGYNHVDPANWKPFAPFGASGIVHGAALIFFAYIGFDAVSTAAEEVKDPARDLPIGIIASLVICTFLYVAVSATITGMVPYATIDPGAPLAAAFRDVGEDMAQRLIGLGGFVGLTTVVLVLLMSQPRIWFAMARDGLLWPWFSKIHPKTRTPMNATILAGAIALVMAAAVPMEELHHMVSIGTLFAFVVVSASILILRFKDPEKPTVVVNHTLVLAIGLAILSFGLAAFMDGADSSFPLAAKWAATLIGAAISLPPTIFMFKQTTLNPPLTFKCPLVPAVPILAMASNIFMMAKLDPSAWIRLFVWLAIGFAIYFLYGRQHSKLDPSFEGDPDELPEVLIPDVH